MNRHQILQRNLLTNLDQSAKWRADEHPVDAPREPVTPEDKLNSLAHMINDIGQMHAHARNHMISAMKFANEGDLPATTQNLDHAQKHTLHAQQASEKLVQHIKEHFPEIIQELTDIHSADPFGALRN